MFHKIKDGEIIRAGLNIWKDPIAYRWVLILRIPLLRQLYALSPYRMAEVWHRENILIRVTFLPRVWIYDIRKIFKILRFECTHSWMEENWYINMGDKWSKRW